MHIRARGGGGERHVNGAHANATFLTANGIHRALKIGVRAHQQHLQIFAQRGLNEWRVLAVGFNQVAKHAGEPRVILALGKNAFDRLIQTLAHGCHFIKQTQTTFQTGTLLAPRRKTRHRFGLSITNRLNRAGLRLKLRVQAFNFQFRHMARI